MQMNRVLKKYQNGRSSVVREHYIYIYIYIYKDVYILKFKTLKSECWVMQMNNLSKKKN